MLNRNVASFELSNDKGPITVGGVLNDVVVCIEPAGGDLVGYFALEIALLHYVVQSSPLQLLERVDPGDKFRKTRAAVFEILVVFHREQRFSKK